MRLHDEHRDMPPSRCPTCGYECDAASQVADTGALAVDPVMPTPGDVSVCINCGEFNEFGPDLKMQPLPINEFAFLPADMKRLLLAARLAIRKGNHERRRH